MASSAKRTRGPNKQQPWSRNPDDGLAVLRLPLDTSEPRQRQKLEAMFQSAYVLRRAVQRDARDRCRAYRAAKHERARDVAAVRDRLGLSKTGLEQTARAHLDAAPHLRRNVTKALAQHIADDIWAPVRRHLFRDASGARQGLLGVTRWFDFTRLPGRARSHTKERVWETFSLRGTLAGHRAAYTDRDGDFVQPRRPVEVIPMGPRKARVDGVPLQSYRKDEVSASYRRGRRAMAAEAEAAARARRDHAREVAGRVVAKHGTQLVVEDTSIAAWARSWGRALAAFSPGMLVDAIDREARAVGALAGGIGGVQRASTHTTALSQHCPCGARVDKRLADRVHRCDACGLYGDRDAVAAVLASFTLVERDNPRSAQVDYAASADALGELRRALRFPYQGWQDTLSESTDLSARDGSFIAWRTSTPDAVAVARRNVGYASCSTLNETGARRTTSDRARLQTNMSRRCGPRWTYLRDNS